MSFDVEKIYALLPAIDRIRDQEVGGRLKALLSVIAEQVAAIEEDLEQRYDDHFIETCASWVVPYIGDLIGVTPLFDGSRVEQPNTAGTLFSDLIGPSFIPEVALRGRADVAKTIDLRRRKATLPMLEELARLVTGWAAHVVEFFERLGWTQYVQNHLRMQSVYAPDLRALEPIDRLDGPFDATSHTVDVRAISQFEGWYNIKNIGFFLWRLSSYELDAVRPRRSTSASYGYAFSPLGNTAPLFSRFRTRGDEAGLASEPHVPGPIRRTAFFNDVAAYYGPIGTDAPDASIMIVRDGTPVSVAQVRCMNLTTWAQPAAGIVGIDVRSGRMAFGPGFEPTIGVEAYYHYGFSGPLGGGSYTREPWQVREKLADLIVIVDQTGATAGSVKTLGIALNVWQSSGKPNAIISIVDSRTYAEPITIEPADDRWLVIEAADHQRPHLEIGGALEITGAHPTASITLSGLLVEGWVHVSGALGRLRLLHTTLVPGRSLNEDGTPASSDPSVIVEPGGDGLLNEALRIEAAFSIAGPMRIPPHTKGLWLLDSILDGLQGNAIAAPGTPDQVGPSASIERTTILGPVLLTELILASETIFDANVSVVRRQDGCVRFSYVPPGSSTPRRFRCQPDLEIADEIAASPVPLTQAQKDAIAAEVSGWLVPSYTSTRYGQPAYAQLHLSCPIQIGQGAEDGSEMGAFCHLKQPQRLANLRFRLREYLPFGLEPGFMFVT